MVICGCGQPEFRDSRRWIFHLLGPLLGQASQRPCALVALIFQRAVRLAYRRPRCHTIRASEAPRDWDCSFQSYALFPTMTVYENIAFGLKVKKMKPEIIRESKWSCQENKITEKQLQSAMSRNHLGDNNNALAHLFFCFQDSLPWWTSISNLDAALPICVSELKRLQRLQNYDFVCRRMITRGLDTFSDRIAVFDNGKIEQVGTLSEVCNASLNRACLWLYWRQQLPWWGTMLLMLSNLQAT